MSAVEFWDLGIVPPDAVVLPCERQSAASMYPTPGSLKMYRGCDGSGSILLRRYRTYVHR